MLRRPKAFSLIMSPGDLGPQFFIKNLCVMLWREEKDRDGGQRWVWGWSGREPPGGQHCPQLAGPGEPRGVRVPFRMLALLSFAPVLKTGNHQTARPVSVDGAQIGGRDAWSLWVPSVTGR